MPASNPTGALMHHSVTTVSNGTAVLVIGGRASPAHPNDSMFVLRINSDSSHWSKVVLHPDSSIMEPRWRHSANCFNVGDGEFVCSGSVVFAYVFYTLSRRICIDSWWVMCWNVCNDGYLQAEYCHVES